MSGLLVLQFSRPDDAQRNAHSRMISSAICKATRSEICHVDIEMPGLSFIGAHIEDGIQERPFDYQVWALRIRVAIPATDAQLKTVYEYARAMIGTPYDVESIMGIAAGDGRLHDPSKLICSSFAKLAVDEKSRVLRVAKDYWLVSPEELRIAATAAYGAVEQRVVGNGPVPPLVMAARVGA
ncbi:MAG TPA: hypothetical protein VGP89_09400 [Candidatus Angelobacter sp.]|jgi:hypothetical protein|nr:hypothetical protein [Candidatus Angelobacter sp.]